MASSTRPSILSSPPQNPSLSEADKRRASSSHSRKIASFISRDSVRCATTSFGSAKKDLGCWSAASMSRSEGACVISRPSCERHPLAEVNRLGHRRVLSRLSAAPWLAAPSTAQVRFRCADGFGLGPFGLDLGRVWWVFCSDQLRVGLGGGHGGWRNRVWLWQGWIVQAAVLTDVDHACVGHGVLPRLSCGPAL